MYKVISQKSELISQDLNPNIMWVIGTWFHSLSNIKELKGQSSHYGTYDLSGSGESHMGLRQEIMKPVTGSERLLGVLWGGQDGCPGWMDSRLVNWDDSRKRRKHCEQKTQCHQVSGRRNTVGEVAGPSFVFWSLLSSHGAKNTSYLKSTDVAVFVFKMLSLFWWHQKEKETWQVPVTWDRENRGDATSWRL